MGSDIAGIVTGFVLFLVLEPAVIYFNFAPWLKEPNRPIPPPERYLHAAVHSFIAMVVTGAILTKYFSGIDFQQTPLMDWYGYNNICVVFDAPPSTYICPVFWVFVAFFVIRFAVEDTKRLVQLTSIGTIGKAISYGVNVILVLVAAIFSLSLAIGPADDMIAHTVPFVALVLALPLVYAMHCWQSEDRSNWYVGAVVAFVVISLVKATFTIIALTHTHLPASIAQPVDILWLIGALAAPFFMPPPKLPDTDQ